MKYSVISFVLFTAFFISCNDKECDPVSPPIDDRVSFEINFLDYSENNYFIDKIYSDTSSELNLFNLYYGNPIPIVQMKYYVKDIEVYLSISTSYQNSILAWAHIDLPARASNEKYSNSYRELIEPIPGEIELSRYRLLHEGRDYIFHRETGYLTFLIPIQNMDIVAAAYRIQNDSPSHIDDLFYGEFFTDLINNSDSVGVLKLIKPRNLIPMYEAAWKLRLKNHYQITPFIGQVSDLDLDIYLKKGDGTESNLINGVRLLELFGFDKLNADGSPGADGKFDYRPGITFRPQTSEIIFPVIQPYGYNIPEALTEYKYQAIYDTLKSYLTMPESSFIIKGKYKPL